MKFLLSAVLLVGGLVAGSDDGNAQLRNRFNLLSMSGDCNGVTFVLKDRYEGRRHRVFVHEACRLIDMSTEYPYIARQVAQTVGLDYSVRFALLDNQGDCNSMRFELYDNSRRQKIVRTMGNDNCGIIDYNSNMRPKLVADQVARYFGLYRFR